MITLLIAIGVFAVAVVSTLVYVHVIGVPDLPMRFIANTLFASFGIREVPPSMLGGVAAVQVMIEAFLNGWLYALLVRVGVLVQHDVEFRRD